MSERHNAINITDHLVQGCAEWGIADTSVLAVVHDNSTNMTAAINSMPWESLPCIAHTLQLTVNKVLEVSEINRLTAVCRMIVGHFKHTVLATTVLKKAETA